MYDKEDILKIDLSEVVQALSVQLEDKGDYYTGKCPFHDDKHESFIVYNNKDKEVQGIWKCFACNLSGDAPDLVSRKLNVTFREALEWIGDTFSIIKAPMNPEQMHLIFLKEQAMPVLNEAVKWYKEQRGVWFFQYLEDRGFKEETIETFEYGYSQTSAIYFKQHLYEKGFTDEQLIASGLFVSRASGIEPIFYGRLMIPIKDRGGHLAGFAGRSQNPDEKSKYITTTASFHKKKKLVYGLSEVRKRKVYRLLITEGVLDVAKVKQETGEYAVSVMGSTIHREQIKEICSTLPELSSIVLALDGDVAGMNGIKKFIKDVYNSDDFHYKKKIDFYVMHLPAGEDLDSLITKDKNLFRETLKEIEHVADFTIRELRRVYDKDDKIKNDRYVSKCLRSIASMESFKLLSYLTLLSELSGYDIERLNKELYIYRLKQRNITSKIYEKHVLRYLIEHPEFAEQVVSELSKKYAVPLKKILSRDGNYILNRDYSRYSTKLLYLASLELTEKTYEEAVFFALLLFASNVSELMIEYDGLTKENRLKINQKTNNEICEAQKLYKDILEDAIRRIDV